MEKDINIKIEEERPKVKVIRLEGILDTLTTPKLDKFMSGLMQEKGICIIANCQNLGYINSTGLSSLILYHIQAKRRESAFKLVALAKFAKELMDVSRAQKLLEIYETEEEALKGWRLEQASK